MKSPLAGLLVVTLISAAPDADDFRIKTSASVDYFPDMKDSAQLDRHTETLKASLSYYRRLGQGELSAAVDGYLNGSGDGNSYFDISEFYYSHAEDHWTVDVGVKKVFWGVVESRHLVDVVNQQDYRQFPDIDAKLGQPMLHYTYQFESSAFEFYLLPYVRSQVFPEKAQHFALPLPVDNDSAEFESAAGKQHLDVALRWAGNWDYLDYGVSVFAGTDRVPTFAISGDGRELIPVYWQKKQLGVDLQATVNNWLLKLEAIAVSRQPGSFRAATIGSEYTFYSVFDTRADIGVLAEYNWDSRSVDEADFLQNDLFLGGRLVLNNIQSTEILAGVALDLDHSAVAGRVELNHRINKALSVSLDAWWFDSNEAADPLSLYNNEDLVRINIDYYFD